MTKLRRKQTEYLWFRDGTPHIWFSRAVPKRLWEVEGKKVIQFSLGTSDRAEARRLARRHSNELDERWEVVATPAPPVSVDIHEPINFEALAVSVGFDRLWDILDRKAKNVGADDEAVEELLEVQRASHQKLVRRYNVGNLSDWEPIADKLIAMQGEGPAKGTDDYQKFVDAIARVSIDAKGVFVRRHSGDLDAEPQSEIVRKTKAAQSQTAKQGESICELFEDYGRQLVATKRKRQAGVDQDRMVISLFAEFVGTSRSVHSITFGDAKEFVDALAHLPTGLRKKKAYAGLSVQEAIEKAKRDGDKSNSIITQQRYISTLSPFFKWLASERGGRKVRENPFAGLHKDTSKLKRANARPPFTADQIRAIIESPLFTGFLADGKEHISGEKLADDWRKWIPLLCLFTGARIGEVAQLRVEDIYRDDGIWCVEFCHDEKTGQRTKSDRSRFVALHSTLLDIGFLEFVERQKERLRRDGNEQLFPEMKPGVRDQYGDDASAWWRDYLVAIGVKPKKGGDGFGSHSFRHTITDQLRAAGHLDNVIGAVILGHSTASVTSGYGQSRQGTAKLSKAMIDSVEFLPIERGRIVEGGKPLDFSHLARGKSDGD